MEYWNRFPLHIILYIITVYQCNRNIHSITPFKESQVAWHKMAKKNLEKLQFRFAAL